jgi:hypothetical protein
MPQVASVLAALAGTAQVVRSFTERPEKPSTPALPPEPETKAEEVKTQALEEQKKRLRRASLVGRQSTILTSQEDLGTAPVAKKTLLGE